MAASTKTIEQTYQKKTQLEHILLRPDSYIGSTEPQTAHAWIIEADGALVNREITFTPGLYKIFDEVLVNAADNKQRDPSMNKLDVTICAETGTITVWNNGASIPVVMHGEHDVYVPELIFGHLLTSSNFDDDEKKVTGGRNGYGAKLANIFSTSFIVETNDGTRGLKFRQEYTDNMSSKTAPAVTKSKVKKDYTSITFTPDYRRFKMERLDGDTAALLRRRVYDMAGISDKSLKVHFNGVQVPVTSFKDYVKLFQETRTDKEFVYERINDRWEVAVGVSDGTFSQLSFVNAICTTKGGEHVNAIAAQVADAVAEKASKKSKASKGSEVKAHFVKNHLFVYVNCLIENPAFDSQTKDTLTTKKKSFGSSCDLPEAFVKRVLKIGVVERVASWARFKESTELAKSSGTKKLKLRGIPKLDDANYAGGARAGSCTLILTEGDSAKALAISGLSIVGRDNYGVFPLRGKLLNVRDCGHAQMMANAEIQALVDILGLKFGVSYDKESVKQLRYGSIMVMADQDHDGSHIKGLVINFIHAYWPSLLTVAGFMCEFITPIIKCTKNKSVVSFYTMPQYAEWQARPENAKGWTVKYYKGLGTSTAAEAKEYFTAIARHRITFVYEGQVSDDALVLAFDKTKADDRKTWLLGIEPGVHVDYSIQTLPYTKFVNEELSLFSLADNIRSIPSVFDGLKPSQRKILFGCFKRKLSAEIKVAQLSGYVSEHAMYHHGEQSLNGTIVGMAQTFVGSNNVNLLYPSGQFGTRLMGGKDAASARYIFTRLTTVTKVLFNDADAALLEYLEEDGVSIEPKWYLPVLPMVLVNGASGIGTGWSTDIPPYNPIDIIDVLRHKLRCKNESAPDVDSPKPLKPWFRGFTGDVVETDTNKYATRGRAVFHPSTCTVVITELPVGKWTQDYKQFLETMQDKADEEKKIAKSAAKKTASEGKISDVKRGGSSKSSIAITSISDQSTDTSVCIHVKVDPSCVPKLETDAAVLKEFHLESTFTTTNMHLFDDKGRIRKYTSAEEILDAFFVERRALYVKRYDYLKNMYAEEVSRLQNKMRFIMMVIDGSIVVSRPKLELLTRLHELEFVPFDDEYDYLLSIPLWSLTAERVAKLQELVREKTDVLESLCAKTPDHLWLDDLEEVKRVLWEDDAAEDASSSVTITKKRGLSSSQSVLKRVKTVE